MRPSRPKDRGSGPSRRRRRPVGALDTAQAVGRRDVGAGIRPHARKRIRYMHSSPDEWHSERHTEMKKQLSAAHAAALQAGRQAAQNSGKTPRELGHERTLAALRWVYLFGWSSAALLEQLVNTNRGGLGARLVRQGLLKKHLSPAGGGIKDAPLAVLTLTQWGEEYVCRYAEHEEDLHQYSPTVGWAQLRHDCIVQRLAIEALANAAGPIRIESDSETRSKGRKGKIHDLVLVENLGDGKRMRTLVEVELTQKKGRELDNFVMGCCNSMLRAEALGQEVVLHLYSDSAALLRHYKQRLAANAQFKSWKRNTSGHWVEDKDWEVPERHAANMFFHNIT